MRKTPKTTQNMQTRPLRILLLCDFFNSLGGTEYYNALLANGLKAAGFDVRIYVGEKPRLLVWADSLEEKGIYFKTPTQFHKSLSEDAIEAEFLEHNIDEINQWKPDIIHVHPFGKMVINWLKNPRSNKDIPIVVTEWTMPANNTAHWFNASMSRYSKHISAYIATCRAVERGILNFHNFTGRVVVIPHLIQQPAFTKITSTKTDPLSVGCISRLSVEKGLDFLIGGWKQVATTVPKATLHIYGHGPELDRLSVLRDSLGLHDSVFFEGTFAPYSGIAEVAAKHPIFVQPSLFESIPTSLIELMLCGRTMVATDVGGIPELVNDKTGVLIRPANTEDISRALISLLENPSKIKKLGKSASQIQASYDYETNLNKIITLYKEIIAGTKD